MTFSKFCHDILRGKGSCFYAVQKDPERFHGMLMQAATRSTAFDPQCEGTRAHYIYELLAMTPNKPIYLEGALIAFGEASPLRRSKPLPVTRTDRPQFPHNPTPCDHDFHFLAELLSLFAKDGSEEAKNALLTAYTELLRYLSLKKARPECFFPERDDFEQLSILLCEEKLLDPLLAIAHIGKLFENPLYTDFDFDIFHDTVGMPLLNELKKQGENADLSRYLHIYLPETKSETEPITTRRRERKTPEEPDDPHTLMEIVDKGATPDVTEEALMKLAAISHPDLRPWALSRIDDDPLHYLPILIRNYREEDSFEVWYALKQIPVDRENENNWHGVHLDLLHMKERGLQPPEKALLFIVRTTFCSCCRLEAIKQLHSARALTRDVLLDALHDSCKDTRDFVHSLLNPR